MHAVLGMAVSEVLRCYDIDRVQSMGACRGCDVDRERGAGVGAGCVVGVMKDMGLLKCREEGRKRI